MKLKQRHHYPYRTMLNISDAVEVVCDGDNTDALLGRLVERLYARGVIDAADVLHVLDGRFEEIETK